MNKKLGKIERKLFHAYLRDTGCELTAKDVKKLLIYVNDLENRGNQRLHNEVLRTAGQNVMLNLAVSAWALVAKRLAEVLKAINDAKHIDLVNGRMEICLSVIPGLVDGDLIEAVLKDYETMAAESEEK